MPGDVFRELSAEKQFFCKNMIAYYRLYNFAASQKCKWKGNVMMKIAPSILASDFSKMAEELKKIDTIGPSVIQCYRPHTRLPFDVHLMIVDPIRYIKEFARAGADYITVHLEAV